MSAPIRASKMASGKVGSGKIKNAGSSQGSTTGPASIKNAVGMCNTGKGTGYKSIKGTVSG